MRAKLVAAIYVVLGVVLTLVFQFVTPALKSMASPVPEGVKMERRDRAQALMILVREVFMDPDLSFKMRVAPDIDDTKFIRFQMSPGEFVSVHSAESSIIVNPNGRMDIHDSNGDGSYDSCWDCSVGYSPDMIQETYDVVVNTAIERLEKSLR